MPRILLCTYDGGCRVARSEDYAFIRKIMLSRVYNRTNTVANYLSNTEYTVSSCCKGGTSIDVDLYSHIAARVLSEDFPYIRRHVCITGILGEYSSMAPVDTLSLTRRYSKMVCAELHLYLRDETLIVIIAIHDTVKLPILWVRYPDAELHTPDRYLYKITLHSTQYPTMESLDATFDSTAFAGCEYFITARNGPRDEVCDISPSLNLYNALTGIVDDETKMIIMSASVNI